MEGRGGLAVWRVWPWAVVGASVGVGARPGLKAGTRNGEFGAAAPRLFGVGGAVAELGGGG